MFAKTVRSLLALSLLVLASFVSIPETHAQSRGGWAIDSFVSDLHLRQDGVLEVTETIEGTFFEPRHGMYRFIPERVALEGTDHFLDITFTGVTMNRGPVPFETSRAEQQEVIKIGDPNIEIDGPFSYEIRYEVMGAVRTVQGEDVFAWNVTGNGWDVSLPSVAANLSIEGVQGSEISLVCYTGEYGSTAQVCTSSVGTRRATVFAEDALTIEARFPTGRIAAFTEKDIFWAGMMRNLDFLLFLLPVWSFLFMYRRWSEDGRDPKLPAVEVVQYDPPDALRPLETLGLMSVSLSSEALAAELIDLAERGHLLIEEGEKGWLKKRSYTLRRQTATQDILAPYEEVFLESIFKGEETRLLKTEDVQMQQAWALLQGSVHEALIEKGYFPPGNAQAASKYIVFGVIILFALLMGGEFINGITGRVVPLLALIAFAIPFIGFGIFMGRRTEKGAAAYAHARGFRTYLKKAEAYRTVWQEQEGIFERLLPYAIGFGVGKKWAKVVGPTLQTAPSWYVGASGAAFVSTDFTNTMTSFANAVTSSATSGGGGGSSGGGGGGGGGGSW